MKKLLAVLIGALVVGTAPMAAQAAPFEDPDILIAGSGYSAVNDPSRWFTRADGSVITAWANGWIEYTAYLTAGNWDIGLNVINTWGQLYPGWNFEFRVYNDWTNSVFTIPGSDTEVFNGFFNTNVTEAGFYTVRYTWTNDRAIYIDGALYDANLRIVSAFFDDPPLSPVPEPGTLLLLGSGLLGLGLIRRTRRQK